MAKAKPINYLCIYRVKKGKERQFKAVLKGHWPAMKKVAVTSANFCALEAKESGFAVERGERIAIRAEGSLTMTPWGGNVISSPDGCAQCGGSDQGAQIMSGTLMMRIGKNGKWIKVGSKANIRATASGSLQFGIAINAQYMRGQQYPGEYTIKIKVGE